MTEPVVRVFPSVSELQDAAADYVAALLRSATPDRPMRIALSGGSTPRRLHELLAATSGIDWTRVQIFFGDERTVGPDDEQSNYRMARDTLLDRVAIPADHVHRMRGEDPPEQAAAEYERVLRARFHLVDGQCPSFDLVLLGMGADGHTASLFPGTAALQIDDRMVVANAVPQLETTRITLTYPVLNAAQRVLFLVAGADKADAVQRVFSAAQDRPPSASVRASGETLWYLDQAAAAQL